MSGTSNLECTEMLLVKKDGHLVTVGNTNSKCERIVGSESPKPDNSTDIRPSTPVKTTTAKGKNKMKKRKTIRKTIRKKRKTIRKTRRKGKNLKKRKTM